MSTDTNDAWLEETLDELAEYYMRTTSKFLRGQGESSALFNNNEADLAAKATIQAKLTEAYEAGKRDGAVEELTYLITKIDEHHADRYPKIVEGDVLTYVDHGYAVACKTIKRNANVRLKALQSSNQQEDNV